MDYLNQIPDELFVIIATYLPLNDIKALQSVSKKCKFLVNSSPIQQFKAIHSKNQHILDILNKQTFFKKNANGIYEGKVPLDHIVPSFEYWDETVQSMLLYFNLTRNDDSMVETALSRITQSYLILELLFFSQSLKLLPDETYLIFRALESHRLGTDEFRRTTFIESANILLNELNQRLIFEITNGNFLFTDAVPDVDTLNLNDFGLTRLTDESCNRLRDMTLKRLYISSNSLFCINPKIGELTTLNILTLSHNFLQEIPESVSALVNLTHVQFQFNLLPTLPLAIQKWNLTHGLDYGPNPVVSVPKGTIDWMERVLHVSPHKTWQWVQNNKDKVSSGYLVTDNKVLDPDRAIVLSAEMGTNSLANEFVVSTHHPKLRRAPI